MEKFDLILTDPPWKQSKGGKKAVRVNSSGGKLDYGILPLYEIKNYQRKAISLCNFNHVCFMWTIDKYLKESENLMLSLGYKLHARLIWNKVTGIPAAFTVRYGHDYLLFFYFGKLLPVALAERGKIHTVFTEKVKKHSQKPEISYEIINRLYPNASKLEMYSRMKRDGWRSWGNEINSDINL